MDHLWYSGQPDGMGFEDCSKFDAETGLYLDVVCSGNKECFVCTWKKESIFTLRGFCSGSRIDRNMKSVERDYVIIPNWTFNEQIFFFGFGQTNILFSHKMKSWLMVEDKQEDLFDGQRQQMNEPKKIVGIVKLNMMSNQLPVGLHLWNITDCEDPVLLKLTSVSVSFYYLFTLISTTFLV